MKVLFETVHFTADEKLKNYIESKLEKLDQFYDRIIDAQVILKLENSGQIKDKIVEVQINVPGDTIFQSNVEKTFEASIDGMLGSLKRSIIKHKELQKTY